MDKVTREDVIIYGDGPLVDVGLESSGEIFCEDVVLKRAYRFAKLFKLMIGDGCTYRQAQCFGDYLRALKAREIDDLYRERFGA